MAQCAKIVYTTEGLASYTYRCTRRGKLNEAGEWWCEQHAPSSQKARDEAQHQKWEELRANSDARYKSEAELRRKGQLYDVLLAAARDALLVMPGGQPETRRLEAAIIAAEKEA